MNIVQLLVEEHGVSKYRISKEINVSWNTVYLWYKGLWNPTEKHTAELKQLLQKIITEKEVDKSKD